MKLWAYNNGARTKKKCANFTRPIPYNEVEMPVSRNGAIITGKYPNGNCLAVFDFDIEIGKEPNHKRIDSKMPKTFTVETGSKGLHYYYWIIGETVNNRAFKENFVLNKYLALAKKGIYNIEDIMRQHCTLISLVKKPSRELHKHKELMLFSVNSVIMGSLSM